MLLIKSMEVKLNQKRRKRYSNCPSRSSVYKKPRVPSDSKESENRKDGTSSLDTKCSQEKAKADSSPEEPRRRRQPNYIQPRISTLEDTNHTGS
ncbi:hypothetical protein Hypma_000424 [Hypsizygus marmoreus]|uniref:Uncharacterized protein n=1 Tax=Hypsizygus marmoreus TaxID=39966 RepID=A0A369J8J1_HYPMA|nr:hypothetical protein Hypma_000424 [Hypsizygus marmoreus]